MYEQNEKSNDFNLNFIEIVIIIFFICILFSIYINSAGVTEKRARSVAENFLKANEISYGSLVCSGDSVNKFSSCNVTINGNDKIILNCPSNVIDVHIFGAKNCIEQFNNLSVD